MHCALLSIVATLAVHGLPLSPSPAMPASVEFDVENERWEKELRDARELLTDHAGLNRAIGLTLVNGTDRAGLTGIRNHIIEAAKSRHKTQLRLGAAEPTHYLEKAASNIEVEADADGFDVTITNSAAIFARTFGAVVVTVKDRKWLAIPCDKRTFGKSPLNFPGMLDFIRLGPEKAVWVMRSEPKASTPAKPARAERPLKAKPPAKPAQVNKLKDVVFLGLKQVTLPQDRGLLPEDPTLLDLMIAGLDAALGLAEEGVLV